MRITCQVGAVRCQKNEKIGYSFARPMVLRCRQQFSVRHQRYDSRLGHQLVRILGPIWARVELFLLARAAAELPNLEYFAELVLDPPAEGPN
jgi:hypothetical protein